MNAGIYNQLLRINQAHAEIVAALAVLRKYPAFDATTLDHFAALWKETRAATNSYLAGAIEVSETEEAGRRYGKRRRREKLEDQGT
jgi:hypothetical protein